jgi:hypothetical protein
MTINSGYTSRLPAVICGSRASTLNLHSTLAAYTGTSGRYRGTGHRAQLWCNSGFPPALGTHMITFAQPVALYAHLTRGCYGFSVRSVISSYPARPSSVLLVIQKEFAAGTCSI